MKDMERDITLNGTVTKVDRNETKTTTPDKDRDIDRTRQKNGTGDPTIMITGRDRQDKREGTETYRGDSSRAGRQTGTNATRETADPERYAGDG